MAVHGCRRWGMSRASWPHHKVYPSWFEFGVSCGQQKTINSLKAFLLFWTFIILLLSSFFLFFFPFFHHRRHHHHFCHLRFHFILRAPGAAIWTRHVEQVVYFLLVHGRPLAALIQAASSHVGVVEVLCARPKKGRKEEERSMKTCCRPPTQHRNQRGP